MRVRTLVRFCLIGMMVLYHNKNAYGLPASEIDLSTTEIIDVTNSLTRKFISELTPTDIKNTLDILLQVLNKQSDKSTLNVVGGLINDTRNRDNSTKELDTKLMLELRKHKDLKKLIENLNFDAASTDKRSPNQFELFPAVLRNAIIEEVLKFHNLSDLIESTTDTQNFTENDFTTSAKNEPTFSIFTTLQSQYTNNEQDSEQPLSNTASTTLKSLDKGTVSDDIQYTVFSTDATAQTSSSSEISSIDTATANQQPNETVPIGKIIENILGKQNSTKTFPALSKQLLNILSKYNLKYVRTYSEILEPLVSNGNKKNKGSNKSTVKRKQNTTTKKTPEGNSNSCKNSNDKLLLKIIAFINQKKNALTRKTISQQNESSTSTKPIQNSELFKKTTKEGVSTVTLSIKTSHTTRKPNRPPGKTFEHTSAPSSFFSSSSSSLPFPPSPLHTLPMLPTVSESSSIASY